MKRYQGLARIGFIWIWELLAILACLSIPVANIPLAIPWGWVFARWAYPGTPEGRGRRAWLLTMYSVVPCFTLTLLPIVLWFGSKGYYDILSPVAASEYLLPIFQFGLPFPFNTIFGFYWGAALLSIILKILVTTAVSRIILASMARRPRRKP